MTVTSCKHQGIWIQVDKFCVQCVEELEKKFELAVNALQLIATNDSMSLTSQELAEHVLDDLNEF